MKVAERRFELISPQEVRSIALLRGGLVLTDRKTPGKFEADELFNNAADLIMPQYEFNEWDIQEIDETGKKLSTIRAEGPQPTTGPESYGDADYQPEKLNTWYPPGSPMHKLGEELKQRALAADSSSGYEDNTSLPIDIRRLPLPQQDVYRMTYNSAKAANLSSEQAKSNAEQALRDMAG